MSGLYTSTVLRVSACSQPPATYSLLPTQTEPAIERLCCIEEMLCHTRAVGQYTSQVPKNNTILYTVLYFGTQWTGVTGILLGNMDSYRVRTGLVLGK